MGDGGVESTVWIRGYEYSMGKTLVLAGGNRADVSRTRFFFHSLPAHRLRIGRLLGSGVPILSIRYTGIAIDGSSQR